ncbi:MAG: hypothetical protein Q4P15_12500 [Propionibacteriaceae bacterium]|nr:hypothetical protein [Propionibacteriaceae bacterium]
MDVAAVLAAWLIIVVVLIASGIGKIRHPQGAEEAFVALGAPKWLNRRWIIQAHPWAEIALATLLLALPHPGSVVAAAFAFALFSAYLFFIWRVVASGKNASCNCFGSLGSATVDRWTLGRNALLALLAALMLVDAALGGSAVARFGGLGEGWWWVLALMLTAGLTYLVTRDDAPAPRSASVDDGPEEDYLRLPIPDVAVRAEASGERISLRDLPQERAQLLFFVQPDCGPCSLVTSKLTDWERDLPEIDFRVLCWMTHADVAEEEPQWAPFYIEEADGAVGSVFGITGRPSAVLLGMDGLLAGGPVTGSTAVEQMVADIQEQIAPTREWADEAQRIAVDHSAVERLAQ